MINRNHPIAAGLGEYIEIEHEEMYGEPFTIPEPLETVFISWFEGGEVFRSGVTFQRGAGRIFYFRPGHEAYPTYHNKQVLQVLQNATRWAYNPAKPWASVDDAPERAPRQGAGTPCRSKARGFIRKAKQGIGDAETSRSHPRHRRHGQTARPVAARGSRVEITGAADVDLGRAKAFAEAHQIPNAFGTLEDAIAWGQFDAAMNVTPDSVHYPTTHETARRQKACALRKAARRKFPARR